MDDGERMGHKRIDVEGSKLQNKGWAIKDMEKKVDQKKRRMGNGDKQSDRDREGLKEMEAAMKKKTSSEDEHGKLQGVV